MGSFLPILALINLRLRSLSRPVDYLEIKFALARKGYTWERIAKELGLHSGPSVSQVAQRKWWSRHVEESISEITGIPLLKLFPDRYGKKRKAA